MSLHHFSARAIALERPGVAGLLINLPVGPRPRPAASACLIEIGRRPPSLLDPLAHPGGIDACINDQMGDVDALGPSSRAAPPPQREGERAGEGGIAGPAAHPAVAL